MGTPKLLLPWGHATVIEQVLAAWRAAGVERVIVVTHPADGALHAVVRASGAELVIADPPPPDMKTSVLRGFDHVREKSKSSPPDAWLTAPADMPLLAPSVISRLIEVHRVTIEAGEPATILVPVHVGRRGHPVLFPWPLAEEVSRLGPDQGLNELLKSFAVREIECGEALVFDDLDTPSDYDRLHGRQNPHDRSP